MPDYDGFIDNTPMWDVLGATEWVEEEESDDSEVDQYCARCTVAPHAVDDIYCSHCRLFLAQESRVIDAFIAMRVEG